MASGAPPSRRSQVMRLRRVALEAVRQYPLPEGRLTFLAHGENTTFRFDDTAGRALVRVHRPERHGRAADAGIAIASEIAWLRAIRTDTDLAVPEVLRASDQRVVVEAEAAGVARMCSVLRWMDGRIHVDSARPVHLFRLGAAMAALHDHADAWTPPDWFRRIRWDHETFFGDVLVYGGIPAADCWDLLPAALRKRFGVVRDRMRDIMNAEEDVGLIHADPHLGNAVFRGVQVQLIDFDDCGIGPRIYDLAVALWELRDADDHVRYRDALVEGYRSVRDIDVTHLDDYIALRQVAFQLWHSGTAQVDPVFAAESEHIERWSLRMLDTIGR
ncbi:MAG: phosphotransferase [Chloroflexi bacterium]|nr:phosphotransferase [Chloroflexota bacterium]